MGLLDIFNTPIAVVSVLLVFSFLPPIVFLIWVRNTERYGREPWWVVIKTFVWGAVFAVIIAIILSMVLMWLFTVVAPVYAVFGSEQTLPALVLALVIAPFGEEAAKAIGIYGAVYSINEAEDGIVYGAASGLGFSATENLFYGVAALITLGSEKSITLIVLRSISSTFLHASATSVTGLGIGKKVTFGGNRVTPYYLLAVAMHASFNLLVSLGDLLRPSMGDLSILFVVVAWILAIVSFSVIRSRILRADSLSDRQWR